MLSKSVRETTAGFTDVEGTTFTAGNAINDVGGGACKTMLNNKIGFRSGNTRSRVKERTRVTPATRTRIFV